MEKALLFEHFLPQSTSGSGHAACLNLCLWRQSISDAGSILTLVCGSFHTANRQENSKNGCVAVLKEDISTLKNSEAMAAGAMGIKYLSDEAC